VSWQLTLTGLAIGILVGAAGMGGGSLLTPLLVLVFGFQPTVAVGTDIVHGALFKTFGAIRHRRLGTVQGQLSGWMLLGSAPMSLVGVAMASWLEQRYGGGAESVEGRLLAAALFLGGLGLLVKGLVRFREVPDVAFRMTARDRVAAIAIGLVGGFVVGLTSVGSGVFFGLSLLVIFPLRSAKVVGTDILHAAALLWVAGLGHVVAGNVDMSTVAWLLAGSIPGVLLGSELTLSVSDRLLRLVLAGLLILSGLVLLDVPGGDMVAVAGVVAVLAAVAGIAIRGHWVGAPTAQVPSESLVPGRTTASSKYPPRASGS
jgi:uncharacterized membrane protein YfcA